MPELPEVEAVCRLLSRDAFGARIRACHVERPSSVAPQTPAQLAASCRNQQILKVERYGKNIFIHLSAAHTLHVHLRMTGNLYVIPDARLRSHTVRVWLALTDGRALVLDDPRALGKLHLHPSSQLPALLSRLGPDPLHAAFTLPYLRQAAARSRAPAKLFLMDQARLAGLGNIWAAEVLFAARIHPARPIGSLVSRQLALLYRKIGEVLTDAIQSSVLSYSRPGHFRTEEMARLRVYQRAGEPCHRCGRAIERITQAGRSTYFCPCCQK